MFVQIIEGHVSDPEHLRSQMQRWTEDLRPGAAGFLGSTGGVTADGTGFLAARFESAESARANSDRPEQGAWWAETETCFDGEVHFTESSDVETLLGGGSDEAGFVQVMKGSMASRDQAAEIDRLFTEHAPQWRPDVIGGLRAWISPTDYVEVFYFTSEAEARTNEQAPPPPELAEQMAGYDEMVASTTYLDLSDPILVS
jgi:hypothetical protein